MSNRLIFSLVILVISFSLIYNCGEKKTKEQLYAIGEKQEKEEKFTDAIKTYQKIVKKFPKTENAEEAQYKIALIYSNNLNDFQKSIESHEALIHKYPESKYAAQSVFMIGFIYANNLDNLDKAKEYYTQFLEKYPEHELVNSVKWELDHLGQDINDIDFLNQEKDEGESKSKSE